MQNPSPQTQQFTEEKYDTSWKTEKRKEASHGRWNQVPTQILAQLNCQPWTHCNRHKMDYVMNHVLERKRKTHAKELRKSSLASHQCKPYALKRVVTLGGKGEKNIITA